VPLPASNPPTTTTSRSSFQLLTPDLSSYAAFGHGLFTNECSLLSQVYRWREAELTHGRVGMLAAAGFLVQEYWHPLFTADGGPAIEQIPGLPPALWFLMTLGIGIAETARIQAGWANPYESMDNIQSLKDDYYPGDLRFDPLGLKPDDPAELRAMQERELSHGRLGMLAAAGFMAQEAVTGQTWGEQDNAFTQFLLGGYFNQEAAELARDAAAGM